MASLQFSNRNVAFHKIPTITAFLKHSGIKKTKTKFAACDYATWFNAFKTQLEGHHSLNASMEFTLNCLESLKIAYKHIQGRITSERQRIKAQERTQAQERQRAEKKQKKKKKNTQPASNVVEQSEENLNTASGQCIT